MADQTDLRDQLLEEEPEERSKRSVWGLVGAVIAVVVIILILLMLPRCGTKSSGQNDEGGKSIVAVPNAEPLPGMVSVWVAPGTKIGSVLKKAGIGSASTELEKGKFIVTVPAGKEADAISRIAAQEGVYDSGRVYEAPSAK